MGNSEGAFGVYFWVCDAVLCLASPSLPSFPCLLGRPSRLPPHTPTAAPPLNRLHRRRHPNPAPGIAPPDRPPGRRPVPSDPHRVRAPAARESPAAWVGGQRAAQARAPRLPGASASVAATLPSAIELPGRKAAASAPLYSPLKIACLAPPCKAAGRSAARQSEAAVGARPRLRARSESRIGPQ